MANLFPYIIADTFRHIASYWKRKEGYRSKLRFYLHSWKFENYGKRCGLGKRVRIVGEVKIHLGDRVTIRDNVVIGGNGILRIGDRTTINEGSIICAMDSVTIGADCMLAPGNYILDVDHKFENREIPINRQGYAISPVEIGDDVWLGAYAIVSRGVKIDHGAVVAGHAFVNKKVEAFHIVGGVPAKPIGVRGKE